MYYDAVRSPAVDVSIPSRDQNEPYRFPIQLTLQSDMPLNSNKTNDFCLGKLNQLTGIW